METRVPSRTGEVNDKQLASNEVMRSAPDRVVWVQVLAGEIVSCSWARHYTITVPFSTQAPRCINGYRRI